MPFTTLGQSADEGLEYPANLPEPLVVAVLDKEVEREKRTTAVLVYGFRYDHPASGAGVCVPENFVTDFASIPESLRAVISPFGRHAKAAVLHDWLYAIGEPKRKWFADQVFSDAMKELGVPDERRAVMYQAVHLFGGGGYDRAPEDWKTSWADWREGVMIAPPSAREAHFVGTWAHPPSPAYKSW